MISDEQNSLGSNPSFRPAQDTPSNDEKNEGKHEKDRELSASQEIKEKESGHKRQRSLSLADSLTATKVLSSSQTCPSILRTSGSTAKTDFVGLKIDLAGVAHLRTKSESPQSSPKSAGGMMERSRRKLTATGTSHEYREHYNSVIDEFRSKMRSASTSGSSSETSDVEDANSSDQDTAPTVTLKPLSARVQKSMRTRSRSHNSKEALPRFYLGKHRVDKIKVNLSTIHQKKESGLESPIKSPQTASGRLEKSGRIFTTFTRSLSESQESSPRLKTEQQEGSGLLTLKDFFFTEEKGSGIIEQPSVPQITISERHKKFLALTNAIQVFSIDNMEHIEKSKEKKFNDGLIHLLEQKNFDEELQISKWALIEIAAHIRFEIDPSEAHRFLMISGLVLENIILRLKELQNSLYVYVISSDKTSEFTNELFKCLKELISLEMVPTNTLGLERGKDLRLFLEKVREIQEHKDKPQHEDKRVWHIIQRGFGNDSESIHSVLELLKEFVDEKA